ncbi:MAG: DUF4249 domain-containing protein [Muribaculaceae bacterium]|nr:DUF4249 domain-containing protein [Muribaculaceae bacterium]
MKKILCIIIGFLFLSCEKELDFEYHSITPELVIEGILTEDGIKVSLTNTTPMNEPFSDMRLSDAKVVCEDMETGDIIYLYPDKENFYTNSFEGLIGHRYILKVEREDKIFESECEMRKAPEILDMEFQWIKMPYDHVAVLQISFKDFNTPEDFYWLKVYRNDEPYKWIISDDRSAVNGVINEVIMTSRKNLDEEDEKDILREGDIVKVAINTISREMYDYLIALENDSNGPSMFSGNYCLGYFMASGVSIDSIVFHPDDLPYFN